jgi:ABC-2 type transport system permease protein
MSSEPSSKRGLPKDVDQLQVVWRYELLKYLRSKRLMASIAIVIAVLALIYILPPVAGSPYRGTEKDSELTVIPMEIPFGTVTFEGYSLLKTGKINLDSLVLNLNGSAYPSDSGSNWVFVESISVPGLPISGNAVLFRQDLSNSTVTASYKWHTSVQDFDTLFVNFASILIVICATFFGADSIVGEFQNRTGYLMFPNPLRRSVLYFGKYAASMTAGLAVLALFYFGVGVLSLGTVGGVDDDFGMSFAFAAEYLMAVMAIAYLISSILKGSTGALVLTFFMFIMILPIIDSVSMFAGVKISASLTFSSNAMLYTLTDPYPQDSVNSDFGITIHQYYPDPGVSAVVMLAYAVIAIALSLVLFKRKQLSG